MNPSVEEGKDLMLRVYAKQIALEHPSWGKAKCYAQAQSEHPELAEDLSPTSQPAYQPPLPGQVAADQARLDQLLKKYMPKRQKVEAKKPREDDGELMLVMAADGTIDHLELR